ncbi:hypothetical protein DRO55_03445 [Candidatus Bathyarchaeota archaeon]|nr:MAG: hypothetical protein DRO55_03445 [Candidatus Bathyarchaeota archaeon]
MRRTVGLIIACVLASIFYWYAKSDVSILNPYIDREMLDTLLIFKGENFIRGYVWTVLTSIFIHAGLGHLAGNMVFLYVFGKAIEDELGSRKVLAAFFTGGILTFILSLPFYGFKVMMLGASAAIFTLTAVVMLTKPLKFSWLFFMPLGLVAILYFSYNVVATLYLEDGGIGYLAHVIGFLIGFPMGIVWSRRKWFRNLIIAMALLIIYFIVMYYLGEFFNIRLY